MGVVKKSFYLLLCVGVLGAVLAENDSSKSYVSAKKPVKNTTPSLTSLFYAKVKVPSGYTRIKGFHSKNFEKSYLKDHCKGQQVGKGWVACYYYQEAVSHPNITTMGSRVGMTADKVFKVINRTNYSYRVDVFPTGIVDISAK